MSILNITPFLQLNFYFLYLIPNTNLKLFIMRKLLLTIALFSFCFSANAQFGASVGYGVGLSPEGIGGGFYLRPNIAYAVGDRTSFNLNYSSISDDGSISSFGLGLAYQF